MEEHMKIKIQDFVSMVAVLCLTTNIMFLVIAVQAQMLARHPFPVPVTSIEIDDKSYTGQIWGKDGVYAILDGDTMYFVADTPGAELSQIEDWMDLTRDTRLSVRNIVIDKGITSVAPKAFGTTQFKNLESLIVEGHQTEVGAYAFTYLPKNSIVEFRGGVDEFGMDALYEHNPDHIMGANPGPDALHYKPFG